MRHCNLFQFLSGGFLLIIFFGHFNRLPADVTNVGIEKSEDKVFAEPTAEKRVIRITPQGFVPSEIKLKKQDSSVFFVNSTENEKFNVAINFGPRRKHCWTKNMEVGNDGVIRTTKPVEPRDFALVCFPESGEYMVTASGEKGKPSRIVAKVIVP